MFPQLTTGRFILRQIFPSDQQQIFEGLSNEEVIRYYGVSYESFEDTKQQMDWYENLIRTETGMWWAICYQGDNRLIGACGINDIRVEHNRGEIGFWLSPEHWNKGIMLEVIPVMVQYAFRELGLHRLEAVIESENSASRKLVEKLEFVYEGTRRECEIKNGRYISLDLFASLNPEHSV